MPIVGDLLDAVDNFKSVGRGFKNAGGWLSPSARREAARKKRAGLPSKKEAREVVWDLGNVESLATILCYREVILLENGFAWKTLFEVPTDSAVGTVSEIVIGPMETRVELPDGSEEGLGPVNVFTRIRGNRYWSWSGTVEMRAE